MPQRASHVLSILVGIGFAAPTLAQHQTVAPAPPQLDQKACSDRERMQGGDTHEMLGSAAPKDSLSDRLARTDGVICPPPDIDPDVHRPAPGGGRTPVIPPPGSPGGDPSERPK